MNRCHATSPAWPTAVREEGSSITPSRSDHAEQLLREALGTRASRLQPPARSYRHASATWRRRERNRRLILAILTALIFTAADAVGLWALNHANTDSHVIFSDHTGGQSTLGHLGQP